MVVLVSGDSDFVPLIRKLNGLGTRVMVVAVNLEGSAKTSQKLIEGRRALRIAAFGLFRFQRLPVHILPVDSRPK